MVLGLGSKPSSCATSAAFSYSTTWLMLAKMLSLISPRMISLGVACSNSARSLTTICGGIETGPVGFSLTTGTRLSAGRCVGVLVRPPDGRFLDARLVRCQDAHHWDDQPRSGELCLVEMYHLPACSQFPDPDGSAWEGKQYVVGSRRSG